MHEDPTTTPHRQSRDSPRPPTGWAVTSAWLRVTAAVVVTATVALVLLAVLGS